MGFNWAMKPLTNKPSIYAKKQADRFDEAAQDPQANRTFDPQSYLGNYEDFANKFNAQVRGGIAGGMEGVGNYVSDMTSPIGLAGMLAGGAGSLIGKLGRGASGAARALGPTMDLIENPGVRQVAGSMDDVNSVIGDMSRNLARIPSAGSRVAPAGIAPSMLPAELVEATKGAQSSYNAGRGIAPSARTIEDLAYEAVRNQNKMSTGRNLVLENMQRVQAAKGLR